MLLQNGDNRDYHQRDDNRNRTIVLQRPRLLLHTDAGDAIFLLANLPRCGFHDEGH